MGCPDASAALPRPGPPHPWRNRVRHRRRWLRFRRCLLPGSGWPARAWGCWPTLLIRRALPQLAGATDRTRLRITTAAATFVLSALLAWRFGSAAELPAYVLLGSIRRPAGADRHCAPSCCRTGWSGPCWGPALRSWRSPQWRRERGDLLSRSRRVRNLVRFVPYSCPDQPKRPRNGRCEARGTTWTVLGLPRLVAAVLWRSPGLRCGRPCLRCPGR